VQLDLGRLQITNLIVHEVPQKIGGADLRPVLSEIESQLDAELRNYFRERLTHTLATAAFDAVFDPATTSPVPGLVGLNLRDPAADFVSTSQQIAQHLHACQTAVNSGGLVVIMRCQLQSRATVAVLKLEKEAGIRVEQTTIDGKATFNVRHLRDLMLTQNTRVFKAGLFVQAGPNPEDVVGKVSDNQRGYLPDTAVADFFLRQFLGCRLVAEPRVATQQFFQAAERFINQSVADPTAKAKYHIALMAELSSERPRIDTHRFAEDYLYVRDRAKFIAFLRDEGVGRVVQKDTNLIQAHLRRTSVDFESGVVLMAPPEQFENEHIKMSRLPDGRTRVQLEDRIKRIRGKH
jgi:hypothetical protein